MNQTTRINFRRRRTFSETMNAIIEFTKRESKDILICILYIAGPAILVASILFALLFDVFFTFGFTGDPDFFTFEAGLYMLGMLVSSIVAQVFVTAVSLDYIYIYVHDKPDKITPEMVWKRSRNTFWGLLVHSLILGFLFIVLYIVVVGGFIAITLVSPVFIALFFIPIALMFYFLGVFSLYFPIYIFEDRGIADIGTIISRCFKLVKDNWWKTFGVFMITSIVVGIVSSVFFMPPYIMMISELFSLEGGSEEEIMNSLSTNWFVVTFFILYVVARFILAFLILAGVSFQYFNLVEQKEAKGLIDTISGIDSDGGSSQLGADKSGDSEADEDY